MNQPTTPTSADQPTGLLDKARHALTDGPVADLIEKVPASLRGYRVKT
ncbi:hypothetical protein ACFQ48_21370 [Hymenobacter caeli]|uniref:Uncharacterized protein n=1 Tax=Hymenobacter caeli TaxID=2735894 RepID=A0ABX2FWS5_9BACT|nr:hypothetical protein [Hymenobacter caeli]NRT21476.1 hypothetical protein [Hymenobacter caeli]